LKKTEYDEWQKEDKILLGSGDDSTDGGSRRTDWREGDNIPRDGSTDNRSVD